MVVTDINSNRLHAKATPFYATTAKQMNVDNL